MRLVVILRKIDLLWYRITNKLRKKVDDPIRPVYLTLEELDQRIGPLIPLVPIEKGNKDG